MNKYLVSAAASLALLLGTPTASLAIFPVVDVGPERFTWIQTLGQDIEMVKAAWKNLNSTGSPWATTLANAAGMDEPLINQGLTNIQNVQAVLRNQGGIQPVDNVATLIAQREEAQIPQEQADMRSAQYASDSAEGDLSAQQAGHRISMLQLSNDVKLRQLMYAQQVHQTEAELDAVAIMTAP